MKEGVRTDTRLLTGFATVDITPSVSLPMGGYIGRNEPAAGTHDPLYAKAIAFRLGETSAILILLDILHVSDTWSRKLRDAISQRIGIPQENILVAATHTHSGPGVFFPVISRTEEIVRYEERLFAHGIEVAEQAFASAEESLIRIGGDWCEGVVMNRRDPTMLTDNLLSVVRIENLSRKVKGHLVSFACHPTVMPPANLDYSADLFGVAAREVEKQFAGSTCIMFNGAAGDASTRFTRREQTWEELERLGRKLARQIVQDSRNSMPSKSGPILAKTTTLKLAFKEIQSLETAQKEFDEARHRYFNPTTLADDREDSLIARSLVDGAAAQLVLSKLGGWELLFGTDTAEVEIQVIRVADLMACGLPGEFFGERGIDLKKTARPKHGFVVGYANGYWGYVVPPTEAAKGGYEAMMSPLNSSDEPKIVREAKALIKEMKKKSAHKKASKNVRRNLYS